MRKRILVFDPPGFSPARQYRGEGVLERLSKIDPDVEIFYPGSEEPWLDLIRADLVFFMRSITDMEFRVAETAIRMGIPIWYDADDDYFNVSEDNPAHMTYRNEAVREKVAWFIAHSNFMTVSTGDLAEKYGSLRPEGTRPIEIVPNALDDYSLDLDSFEVEDFEKTLTWRGGATHQVDLLDFTEQFWNFLEKAPEEWVLLFIGANPKFIREGFAWKPKDFGTRVKTARYILDYHAYLETFRFKMKPWAHVVPLSDNPFNRSKSNIAALEAIYAGAIPIVPDWEEWQAPAALRYKKIDDFSKLMEKAIRTTPAKRREIWKENMDWVKAHYTLSKVNQKRINIVRQAMEEPVFL